MFRPPIARGMRVLDRALFQRTIPLKAARIFENKNISKIRSELERAKLALDQDRIAKVHADPEPVRAKLGKKCILLRPQVKHEPNKGGDETNMANGHAYPDENGAFAKLVSWPHSPVVAELVTKELISIIPYDLHLDYNYWLYHDIISAILPPEAQDEIPSGFSQVGHVAHLNLRSEYLPYKHLIAEVLLDKNPNVRTVINKIDDVGYENEFRTFQYEVLAGPDDMNVIVSEANCTFAFDYSKVYWNSRLQTEHQRLVSVFKEGEAVCDVMAGIGPFAVPAGKKGVFVWANDLNPDSYASLTDAILRNKVGQYVKAFNMDGRAFIRSTAAELLDADHDVQIKKKQSRNEVSAGRQIVKTLAQPKVFQHYILNLPASALTFLSSFVGLYSPGTRARLPCDARMPVLHVYCFGVKNELNAAKDNVDGKDQISASAEEKICAEICRQLQFDMQLRSIEEGGIEIYDVRDVAPKKRMFCASFRLPEEVAFRIS